MNVFGANHHDNGCDARVPWIAGKERHEPLRPPLAAMRSKRRQRRLLRVSVSSSMRRVSCG